jgi:hypothetical protein
VPFGAAMRGPGQACVGKAHPFIVGDQVPLAHQEYISLHQLSVYLTGSDLYLDIAVNLDGGGSTGILVANPHKIIPSKVLLPFVILVYAR